MASIRLRSVKWVGASARWIVAAYKLRGSNRRFTTGMNGLYPAGSTFKALHSTVAWKLGW